jgi:hypothetical protein
VALASSTAPSAGASPKNLGALLQKGAILIYLIKIQNKLNN